MTVRPISKEDQLQAQKIQSVAFEFPFDLKVKEEDFKPNSCWGAYDDDGTLFAEMYLIPQEMYFNGHIVKSTGIGGVATLPQYRHKKGIRAVFEAVFKQMRLDGQLFSQLYPFSFAYYNKFGYESVYRKTELTIPFSLFNHIERNTSCRMVEDRSCPDLRTVYKAYAARHNCALHRTEEQWNRRISENPYQDKAYCYIHYRADGTPGGYFRFNPQSGDGGKKMSCNEFFYLDKPSLIGMLGFMRNFEADYNTLIVHVPADEDFTLLFTNQYQVSRKEAMNAMARVNDVEKVLPLMAYPAEVGWFSIKVTDPFLSYNNGIFDVAYADGKAAVTRRDEGPADLETDEKALARLILGTDAISSYIMSFDGRFKVNSNLETLEKVFVRRSIFLGDYF